MISDETRQLLRWHAGLHGDPLDPESISGSLAAGRGVPLAVAAFMTVLARLNLEMNGAQPSTAAEGKDEVIPRDAAYAISEVTRLLGETAHVIEAWEVDTAWNAGPRR